MIVPDANLLLYAYNTAAAEHPRARHWLEENLSAPAPVGLTWQTLTAFIRIGTHARAFPAPYTVAEVTEIVTAWLARPNVAVLPSGAQHWAIFARLLAETQATGALVMDVHLAATCLEHGATLATTDRDFIRFSALSVIYPLAR